MLEEAARRDHRKLGADLDLFSFPDEIGSGLAVFHPKGGIIRREMENYSRVRHEQAGYAFVNTPHITKAQLFETSGHLGWYADGMFPPMEMEGATYYLKPMNCPFHDLIFRSRGRSYRELPLRMFEFGTVYRYEKSGVVHGLTRVRGMTQDDAHIFCTEEQMPDELKSLLRFVLDLLRDYGLDDFYLELSTRNPEKSVGTDENWEKATEALRQAAERVRPGAGAGPGRRGVLRPEDQRAGQGRDRADLADVHHPGATSTCRSGSSLEYSAANGGRERPVMIHRALFGSIERFFGVLTEHYAGAFPAWLAPVQVVGIPIRDDHADYLTAFVDQLQGRGHPGRGRLLRRPDAEEDPHRPAAEDPVHGDRRRRRRVRRHGVVPLPRRLAAQRRAASPRRWRTWPRWSAPGSTPGRPPPDGKLPAQLSGAIQVSGSAQSPIAMSATIASRSARVTSARSEVVSRITQRSVSTISVLPMRVAGERVAPGVVPGGAPAGLDAAGQRGLLGRPLLVGARSRRS